VINRNPFYIAFLPTFIDLTILTRADIVLAALRQPPLRQPRFCVIDTPGAIR
jgi:hypothetical protein